MNLPHANFKNDMKSTHLSVTLSNGKTYNICSKPQMDVLLNMAVVRIMADMAKEGLSEDSSKTSEEAGRRLEAWREDCGHATVEWVMSRMPPEERERWKDSYRFAGVNRKMV